MVSPGLIVSEIVLEVRNVQISNPIPVRTGLDGVPGHLHRLHAIQQRDARPVHATVVTQIIAKVQPSAVKMLSIPIIHVPKEQSNYPLNFAAHGPIPSVVRNKYGNRVDRAMLRNVVML